MEENGERYPSKKSVDDRIQTRTNAHKRGQTHTNAHKRGQTQVSDRMEPSRLEVKRYRLLFALIASHGFTDLDSRLFVPIYSMMHVLPLPPKLVFALFLASSVVHFEQDVGLVGSLLLHATATCVRFARGPSDGFAFMMAYSFAIHIPMHATRMLYSERYFGLACLLVFGCAFSMGKGRVPSHFCLTERMQRIVISHILVEKAHALGWAGRTRWDGGAVGIYR